MVLSAITRRYLAIPWQSRWRPQLLFWYLKLRIRKIYSRLKASFLKGVCHGVVSSLLDSVIFIVLGLSPLFSGFIPWSAVPNAILGQFTVKSLMQVWYHVLLLLRNLWEVETNDRKTN
jgi:uncharacterized PurR-regulated membrane protein YhhQ (DUF165 family)